ncbi:MAG: DUF1624 domain-containing protein [Candidatus Omnitrophica bacterium]|nr:DUF1624 domain-containing protein [Candidatus Omnitrophota bacterium]
MSSRRYTSIEFLKGLGIIYLIGLHEWVWMWLDLTRFEMRWPEMAGPFPCFGYFSLHVFGFEVPLLAGVTFYIATVRKNSGFGFVAKRALGLLSLGFLINYMCWGIYGIDEWDVLQFIALAMMMTFPLIRWLPRAVGVGMAFGMGCAALALSDRFPWQELSDQYWYAIVIGSQTGEHFWPLCPWLFVFTAGLLIGYVLETGNGRLFGALLPAGLALVAVSLATGDYHPVVTTALWGGDMFKASPFYILGITGTSMVWIWGLETLFRRSEQWRRLCERSFMVKMGRAILWLFLLNTIAGYHATHYVLFHFRMTFPQALAAYLGLVAGTLIIGYLIAYIIDRRRKVDYA